MTLFTFEVPVESIDIVSTIDMFNCRFGDLDSKPLKGTNYGWVEFKEGKTPKNWDYVIRDSPHRFIFIFAREDDMLLARLML